MRRLLLSLALLACFAAPALAAQGMNLRWDACLGDGGVRNKDFACDVNTGEEALVASYVLDQDFGPVSGVEFTIDIVPQSGIPTTWWHFRSAGACRRTSLGVSAAPPANSSACRDAWQGWASGGISGYQLGPGGQSYRLTGLYAVATANYFTANAGEETFLTRLVINHAFSTGANACTGCADPVCIGLTQVRVTRPVGVGNTTLYTETQPGSCTVGWQGSMPGSFPFFDPARPQLAYRGMTCFGATPARNGTWGSIKSLYR